MGCSKQVDKLWSPRLLLQTKDKITNCQVCPPTSPSLQQKFLGCYCYSFPVPWFQEWTLLHTSINPR